MTPGSTDGRHLRKAGIPTYGHSGLASDEVRVCMSNSSEKTSALFIRGLFCVRLLDPVH